MRFQLLAGIAALVFTSPAAALDQKMVDWCIGKNNPTPQQIARGCTAAIESKRFTGEVLGSVYLNRGLAYRLMGQNERALREYDQAARLAPRYPLLYINRTQLMADLGRHDEAIADATIAIRLSPKAALAFYNRGTAYIVVGKHNDALADFDQAIKLDPKYGNAYNNRANVQIKLKNYEAALADATMAIRLVPKSAPRADQAMPRGTRADAYKEIKHYSAAITDLTEAISFAPRPEYWRSRMSLYEIIGEPGLALKDAERLVALDPQDALAWNSRCWFEALTGKLEEALANCNKSIALAPNSSHSLDSRALVYLKMGRFDEAIADYDAALRTAGYSSSDGKVTEIFATHLYGRGLARQKKGDVLGSTVDLAAAKAAKPDLPALYARYLKD